MENIMGEFNPQKAMQAFNTESKFILTMQLDIGEKETESYYVVITAPNSKAAMVGLIHVIANDKDIVSAELHEVTASTTVDVNDLRKAISEVS